MAIKKRSFIGHIGTRCRAKCFNGGLVTFLVDEEDTWVHNHSWYINDDGAVAMTYEGVERTLTYMLRPKDKAIAHRDGNSLNNKRGNLINPNTRAYALMDS